VDAIKFERKGDQINAAINIAEAVKLRTSSGRPGTYGECRVTGPDGKPVRVSINVFQTGKPAPVSL
jgi:hypothetical protein